MTNSDIQKYLALVIFLAVGLSALPSSAQENNTTNQTEPPSKPPKEYVKQTFNHTQLYNCQTNEVLPKRSLMFRIQHRFGAIGVDDTFYKQFLGMDLPANIRLGLSWAVTKNFMMGIGRTKKDKVWDLNGKYALLKQTKDNRMPFSLSIYGNVGLSQDDLQTADSTLFFADSTTLYEAKFAHRVTYTGQLILSRKFGRMASIQLTPTFVYRNLADVGKDNHTIALPISGRIRIGMRTFVVFEYAYVFNNRTAGFRDPLSIGIEISTAGHAFQVMATSTDNILDQDIYPDGSYDYTKGEFVLGFNITRKFFVKERKKKRKSKKDK